MTTCAPLLEERLHNAPADTGRPTSHHGHLAV